jgi:hypothetical protein
MLFNFVTAILKGTNHDLSMNIIPVNWCSHPAPSIISIEKNIER